MNARASALAPVALLAAGCGGSTAAQVASLGTTVPATTTTTSRAPSPVKWATCMNAHGIAARVGPGGHGFMITADIGPNSPQFQAAQRACTKFQPGGGPPQLTPAQEAERARALSTLAACMRKHGVSNFPDPNGHGDFGPGILEALDPGSPVFKAAYKACWSLYPKVGPQIRFGP